MTRKKQILNDEEIMALAKEFKAGSGEAFKELYAYFRQSVYRFCYRMLGDEAQAKDAFQETFIKVYERQSDYRGGNFAAWLFIIARRSCLNNLRSRKEKIEFDETFHTASWDKSSDTELAKQIDKALETLPISLREAVVLREFEEMSYTEIADILKIEVSLAKVRVFRGRAILRKLLENVRREIYES